ncbi:MAG: helix-turn-helix domain-containing protein, partial [Actinobacteria bacterium]|nr:helix-turn-helix domain-containing protein [Actinomycetota bacterium]
MIWVGQRLRSELLWNRLVVTVSEREEISRGVAVGDSLRIVAARIGRAPSTISRERARNGGHRQYRAHHADRAALPRARRPKPSKLATNPRLSEVVEEKLGLWWSPLQISRWLESAYPDDEEMRVSHETIY